MNRILLFLGMPGLIAGAMVCSPLAAHADEPVPPAIWDERLAPALDCDALSWSFTIIHYQADFVEVGADSVAVWSAWYEVGRDATYTGATVTECPEWTEHDGGADGYTYSRESDGAVWSPEGPVKPVVWSAPVEPDPIPHGIVWKVGVEASLKVGLV